MIFLCFAVSPSASRSLCQCSVDSKTQLHFKQCKCCKKGDQTHASLHQMSASSDKRFYSPNKVWRHFSVDGESSCWSESVAVSGKRWFYILLTVLTVVCRWPGAYLHPHLGHLADAATYNTVHLSEDVCVRFERIIEEHLQVVILIQRGSFQCLWLGVTFTRGQCRSM